MCVLFRVQRAAAPVPPKKVVERIEYVDKIEYKEVGILSLCMCMFLCVWCLPRCIIIVSVISLTHSLSDSLSLLHVTCCLCMSLLAVSLSLNIYAHSCTGWEDRLQGSTIRNYKIQGSPGRSACAEDRHQGGCILNTATGRMQMLASWCLTTLSRHSFFYDFPPLSRLNTYL